MEHAQRVLHPGVFQGVLQGWPKGAVQPRDDTSGAPGGDTRYMAFQRKRLLMSQWHYADNNTVCTSSKSNKYRGPRFNDLNCTCYLSKTRGEGKSSFLKNDTSIRFHSLYMT